MIGEQKVTKDHDRSNDYDNSNGEKNSNGYGHGDGNGNTPKNMCSKPDHNHEWKDCPDNPYSKNYRDKDGDDKKGGGG